MSRSRSVITSDWREGRRLRAWELHQQGWKQRQIAAELGVTQGAVSQWIKLARKEGQDGLKTHPHRGRQPALTDEQLSRLPELLKPGAEFYGFIGNRWTTVRIAAVLKQVFGISYHPAHISRILRKHYPGWRQGQTK